MPNADKDQDDFSLLDFSEEHPLSTNFPSVNLSNQIIDIEAPNYNLNDKKQLNIISVPGHSILDADIIEEKKEATYGKKVTQIDTGPIAQWINLNPIGSTKIPQLSSMYNVPSTILLSPAYPQSPKHDVPPLGSVLQTPPDLTPAKISKSLETDLPRVPRVKEQLLGHGTVVPTQTPMLMNLINELPSIQSPSQHSPYNEPKIEIPQNEETKEQKIKDAKERADYRVKFSILREAYPNMEIPEPSDNQTMDEIKTAYKEYVKRIHIDSSVEQNKVYLLILWLLIEVVGARLLKLPFSGYTMNQFKYLNKYQMLLIELGERSYSSSLGEGWPVELRLLAMALFNGVIFILVKLLADKLGGLGGNSDSMAEELRNIINDFLTQNKGADVLRRAEQATADNPPPPMPVQEATPPLGGFGNLIANFASMFTGMGTNTEAKPAAAPQIRRPTTFGARNRRNQTVS